jgi:secondary thiamine-phosphate synthase enzyme
VFVNEWQQALRDDYRALLERLVPDGAPWAHNDPGRSDCERGNAAAHLRALLLGFSVRVQIGDGRLVLGRWQRVILAELDGPRRRDVSIQIAAC